jgi:hypothetical protein
LNNTARIFTKNQREDIFQTQAVKFVHPINNITEKCQYTSAGYEDLIPEYE